MKEIKLEIQSPGLLKQAWCFMAVPVNLEPLAFRLLPPALFSPHLPFLSEIR